MDRKETEASVGAQDVPSPRRRKGLIAGVVVAAVVVIAGAGMWVWHEQPSFCGAICHTPMASYGDTYFQEEGVSGIDKWGNEVENTSAMLAVSHRMVGKDCLSCHVPTLDEQVSEGLSWVSGSYEYPLYERTASDMTEARGTVDEAFCMNDTCHRYTREELAEKTDADRINPHSTQHGEVACTDCHKAHRASVVTCSQCHDEVEIPEGWLTYDEAAQLLGQQGVQE